MKEPVHTDENAPYTYKWKEVICGVYTLKVKAYDNETYSGTTSYVVLIDVHIVDDIGYITDDDADGIYDTFHDTGIVTILGRDGDNYLIDSDGDSEWEYIYNSATGEIKIIRNNVESSEASSSSQLFSIFIIIIATAIITVLCYWVYHDQKKLSCRENS